ncbi:hypothetical protein [Verrucosispora sioxanthis]|uniref:hypothetical protein n=1 Tax=Verrucosispora sioxanthis TaxID=2499994 RepID=UPI001C10C4C8|nr:hypothetical protein [Verrucosispora sioxanthis]
MSQRRLGTATLALGLVVLTDVLRVFLPSVITIFGQAASTPAELLGAFAVGWFVLALVAPALVARNCGWPAPVCSPVWSGWPPPPPGSRTRCPGWCWG